MATVTDNFNRASLGANWSTDTGLHALAIQSSTVVSGGTAADDNASYWNANSFTNDQDSQLVWLNNTPNSDDGGPTVRNQTSAAGFYLADCAPGPAGNGGTTMFRYDGTGFHALGSGVGVTYTSGDTLKLTVTGTSLVLSQNGTTRNTQTDSTWSSGNPGIHCFGNVITFDSWQSTAANTGSTGTLSVTLAAVTSSSTGTVAVHGAATPTLGAVTSSATGTVLDTGAVAVTLGALLSASTGTVGVTASLSVTLAAATLSAAASVKVQGTASDMLDVLTGIATGTVAVAAATAVTLSDLSSSATGTVSIVGSVAITLGDATLVASAGSGASIGSLSLTLDAATASATGAVTIKGAAAITLDSLTSSITVTVVVDGVASPTLSSLAFASVGVVLVSGVTSATLGALTSTVTGAVAIAGTAAVTLRALASTATGTVLVTSATSVMLATLVVHATGTSGAQPTANPRVIELAASVDTSFSLNASIDTSFELRASITMAADNDDIEIYQGEDILLKFTIPADQGVTDVTEDTVHFSGRRLDSLVNQIDSLVATPVGSSPTLKYSVLIPSAVTMNLPEGVYACQARRVDSGRVAQEATIRIHILPNIVE